jgi:protein gp37
MNKTKIEWADYTWNPVTGCLHNCPYCYARRIAERFAERLEDGSIAKPVGGLVDIANTNIPYPYGFAPTFHRYRLAEPQKIKQPQKIFVCSMADLFGEWVPDEWIGEVFNACENAPQHTYMFLTKNPKRYQDKRYNGNIWLGNTITRQSDFIKEYGRPLGAKRFYSIEPLLGPVNIPQTNIPKWVIIGAQTGPGAVPPKPEWVQNIIDQCRVANVPVFVKSPLYEKFPIQEWPEGLK